MSSVFEESVSAFFAASESGDQAAVKQHINQLTEKIFNYQDRFKNHCTALMLACRNNHELCVEELLTAPGLDVNLKNFEGHTALMLAADGGFVRIVRQLLAVAAVNVNLACQDGSTTLWLAAARGHGEIVRDLLAYPGIDVNVQGRCRQTALIAACAGHYPTTNISSVVASLLKHPGVQLHIQDEKGNTAIMAALERGDANAANSIVMAASRTTLDHKNAAGQTVLHLACQKGYYFIAAPLILNHNRNNVDVNAQDNEGKTPLMYALAHDYHDLHFALLDHPRIDTRLSTKTGYSALEFTRDPLIREHLRYLELCLNYSWLSKRLLNAHFGAELVWNCEHALVIKEGFATQDLFASISPASFTAAYLTSVGVKGLGLQTYLLRLHKEMHVPLAEDAADETITSGKRQKK